MPSGWVPDLVVAISDFGRPLNPVLNNLDCPKAFLSIDTWQCPVDYLDAARYDFVFAAQREFVPRLRATGSRHVHWLPLGCNPSLHRPMPVEQSCDIAFVGSIAAGIHDERIRLLDALSRRFTVQAQKNVHGDAMCRALCAGRLVFNHCAVFDLNMRVFEALAMGQPLLTNRDAARNGLLDLFEDGAHLLVYDDAESLIAIADRYLRDEAARLAVGEAGRREVLAKHTYRHRVQEIFNIIGEAAPGFPAPAPMTPRSGLCLTDYLPAAPGVVVDLGGRARDARGAVKERGARAFIGIGPACAGADAYDAVYESMAECRLRGVGCALIETMQALPGEPANTLRFAWEIMDDGGALLWRIAALDWINLGVDLNVEALALFLRRAGFHQTQIIAVHQETARAAQSWIVQARRRSKSIANVVDEGLRGLPFDHPPIRDFVAVLPEGM